jgi:SAM-dependent methyltransferase
MASTGYTQGEKVPTVEAAKVVGYDGKDFEYCPYTETSKAYDQTRAPLGLDIAFGNMVLNSKPICEQDLLDLGCGTGTFLAEAMKKVRSCTGLEYNDGMLEEAMKNVPGVKLLQGSGDALPFEDKSFDVVTINQVVHHFPNDDGFAFLQRCVKEVARVLRPGGCVIISTSAPEQQRDGFWWLSLFPGSSAAICSRFPPIDIFVRFLEDAGLKVGANGITRPTRTLMAEQAYLDKYGRDVLAMAQDPAYRSGDSSWAMAEAHGELATGIGKLEQMSDKERASFLDDREELRRQGGQATFLCGRK